MGEHPPPGVTPAGGGFLCNLTSLSPPGWRMFTCPPLVGYMFAMAGSPKKSVFMPLTVAAQDSGLPDGPTFVEDWLAGNRSMTELAVLIGRSREYVSRTLHDDEDYRAAIDRGMRRRADALAEEGLKLVDDLAEEAKGAELRDRIGVTRLQVNQRNFLAAALNREKFGSSGGGGVTINMGSLHLDALRKMRDVTPDE